MGLMLSISSWWALATACRLMITMRSKQRKRFEISPQPETPDVTPEHVPLSGQTANVVRSGIRLLLLNVEGITKTKIFIISHVAITYDATAILLQETHADDANRLKIPGYDLAAHTNSSIHGIATFARNSSNWVYVDSCGEGKDLEWTIVKIEAVTVMNVYKPPNTPLQENSISSLEAPAMHVGDFNSHGVEWGYNATNRDGLALENWASACNTRLVFDPKQPDSFRSARRGTTTNPELAFVNLDDPLPSRIVSDPFPRSQHRPTFISPINPIVPTQTIPLKRWNFR